MPASRFVLMHQTQVLGAFDEGMSAVMIAQELIRDKRILGDICIWYRGRVAALCMDGGCIYTEGHKNLEEDGSWIDYSQPNPGCDMESRT